jgi:hypothetical protein
MTADLHIHSTASDGTLTPAEIITQALRGGLTHIALTDHDTVDGLLSLDGQLQPALTIIPGIEMSTDLPLNEVHILGLYIDIHHLKLVDQLQLIAKDRYSRAKRIIQKLQQLGYVIHYDQVLHFAKKSTSVGRPHIALALIEQGYFTSLQEVFDTLLKKNGPAYLPHYKLSISETIQLIKSVGGIPILAHPGLVGDDNIVLEVIHAGIEGIEVFHPNHSATDMEKYMSMAEQYGLTVTGGSDFHGLDGRFPESLGEFKVSCQLAKNLESLWKKKLARKY